MRAIGAAKPTCAQAHWLAARGEALPLCESSVDLLGYGSSFNVLDPSVALAEAARVLRRGGHWLAVWNHRDTEDPLQAEVERCIRRHVPGYQAGARREDPRPLVRESGLFEAIDAEVERFAVEVEASQWLRAWQAHATLRRQAGAAFARVLADIERCVQGAEVLRVPYHTRAYWARRR
jgi:ubiquinone/menaquinone biosynthesis C-methylase UbiE